MASVFRKVTSRPLPAGATVKAGTAKWKPRGSTRSVSAPVVERPDGRLMVNALSATWWIRYRDADGRLVEANTGCRDEANARQRLAHVTRLAEKVTCGTLTPRQARAVGRTREPLEKHFDAYVGTIRGKRGGPPSPVHTANVRRYLLRLASDLGWRTLGDISRSELVGWIQANQRIGEDGRAIRSAANVNRHLTAAKAFGSWAASHDVALLPVNPFVGVAPVNEEADPRRQRRALTPDELVRLCGAAASAPRNGRAKLDGPGRAYLWYFLSASGWRVNEVRSIRVRHVDLESRPPVITLEAGSVKARRIESVPIRRDLIPGLRLLMEGKAPDDRVFTVPGSLVKRFDADCARAGIPKRDSKGRTADVHALRHSFTTHLAATGAGKIVNMAASRHSTSSLTEKVYTHAEHLPVAEAIERTTDPRLASMFAGPSTANEAANEADGDRDSALGE